MDTRGLIRVDWVTVLDAENCRYRMPYHFQFDNESVNVPDVNPMYVRILADDNGLMQ